METYIAHVYALYLSWFQHRFDSSDLNEASAHGMALITVAVPIVFIGLGAAIVIDRRLGLDALRAVNMAVGLLVIVLLSKYMDSVISRQRDRVSEIVESIQAGSRNGPLRAYAKGIGLLLLQTSFCIAAMVVWA